MHQRQIKAYGTFIKRKENIYRPSAYIQWGDSTKSLGACLLLNPGSATLNEELNIELDTVGSASGLIDSRDPTMQQLIHIVKGIYCNNKNLSGRFHIYNLFNLQHGKNIEAIENFEELCNLGLYKLEESLVPVKELKLHPWILLGWGVEYRSRWRNLQLIKDEWINRISNAGIYSFGKKKKGSKDYYHPCPLKVTDRPIRAKELISLFKGKSNIQRFSIYATKQNLIVSMNELKVIDEQGFGWSKSTGNPENIVKGFSQLRIKEDYKLKAYQYTEGGNGNGIVWAIPYEEELTDIRECTRLEEYFLSPPKPDFALEDFMEAIIGDKSPLSYLQASVVYHELHEYGAMWHGVSWGRDVILPVDDNMDISSYHYEWEMMGEYPEFIEPHFYYNEEGNPVVVFYTINDIGTITLNRYEHTFSKEDYTLNVNKTCIATAGGGIIF
jgi:hypothetical protein